MKTPDEFWEVSEADTLDPLLRAALRPASAPKDFAERVLTRVHAESGVLTMPRPKPSVSSRWGVAAVLLMMLGVSGYLEHARERRIAGEQARQQVWAALRITSATLWEMSSQAEKSAPAVKTQKEKP